MNCTDEQATGKEGGVAGVIFETLTKAVIATSGLALCTTRGLSPMNCMAEALGMPPFPTR